jgi:dCTP deaminase
MSFWSGEKLKEEVGSCIIGQYDPDNIDCAAYTLHVGPEIFVTPDHYESNPSQNTKKTLGEKEAFNIPSGQFAFLLTEETICISNKCIAFISMKASTKFKGLVNVSGFHVDPGYKGRLVFSVFNAGPMPIKLQRGMPLFLMWLADLDRQTRKQKDHAPITELELKIIDPIHGPIFSPQAISESVKSFKNEIKEDVHRIDKKLSNLAVTASILATLITGVAVYQIKHLMDVVDKLTETNFALNSAKETLEMANTATNKLIVMPDKIKTTRKPQ